MLAWRFAMALSKDPANVRRGRLLFTMYLSMYLGYLLYVRGAALRNNDKRTLTVSRLLPNIYTRIYTILYVHHARTVRRAAASKDQQRATLKVSLLCFLCFFRYRTLDGTQFSLNIYVYI